MLTLCFPLRLPLSDRKSREICEKAAVTQVDGLLETPACFSRILNVRLLVHYSNCVLDVTSVLCVGGTDEYRAAVIEVSPCCGYVSKEALMRV
jgi:hypothetical protein